jgi:uncharacterized membrane protein YjgN (DUF898 family)
MNTNDSPYGDYTAPPEFSQPPAPPVRESHQMEFTGTTGEFFGIWIVNVVLTILTLGIYSAWAKVRTHRYFYSNTKLAGTPFEFLANPIQILKGRLIAYVFVIVMSVAAQLQLFYIFIPIYLLLIIGFPWLIYLSLRFRARYSAWRGLKFRFVDGVFESYVNFMFKPLLAGLTMYLLVPWAKMSQHEYIGNGHRFGGKRFTFQGELGKYYKPFLIAMGIGIIGGMLFFGILIAAMVASGGIGDGADPEKLKSFNLILMPFIFVFYGLMFALSFYVQTKYLNLLWNGLRLGAHSFVSTLRAREMIWLYFSNGIVILLTLGLGIPWAMIRMARYRAQHFVFVSAGSMDEFTAEFESGRGAAGEELADALDLDLDISL